MLHRLVAVLPLVCLSLAVLVVSKWLLPELFPVALGVTMLLLIMLVPLVGLEIISGAISVEQQRRDARLVRTGQSGLLPVDRDQLVTLGPLALAQHHQREQLRASHPPVPQHYAPLVMPPPAAGARPVQPPGEPPGPTGTGPLPLRPVRRLPRRPDALTGGRAAPDPGRSDLDY